jgi:hypothetical protein
MPVFAHRHCGQTKAPTKTLVWGTQKRIITGSDLLGRLLRNIVAVESRATALQQGASSA